MVTGESQTECRDLCEERIVPSQSLLAFVSGTELRSTGGEVVGAKEHFEESMYPLFFQNRGLQSAVGTQNQARLATHFCSCGSDDDAAVVP